MTDKQPTDVSKSKERVTDALSKRAITLDDTDPETRCRDLTPLYDIFADNRIIGLGEGTHGTREFFRLKHRIIRHLIENFDMRLVGLETNFTKTIDIDRYVRHGEGDAQTVVNDLYSSPWKTEEILAMVEWLRAFNADRTPEDRVGFYGIDMQQTRGAAEELETYLEDVESELLERVQEGLDTLIDPGLRPYAPDDREHRLSIASSVVSDLKEDLEQHCEEYVIRASEQALALAQQHVTIIEQCAAFTRSLHATGGDITEEAIRVRNRSMAENVAWILDYESRDRIALWAHNDHINKEVERFVGSSGPPMGQYLTEWYDDYYALGFEFGCGAFQAVSESADEDGKKSYMIDDHTFDGPLPDTVGSIFAALDLPISFLDIDGVSDDSALADWLTREQRFHQIPWIYDPDQMDAYTVSHIPAEAFDGLCYVHETTPARHLSRR